MLLAWHPEKAMAADLARMVDDAHPDRCAPLVVAYLL